MRNGSTVAETVQGKALYLIQGHLFHHSHLQTQELLQTIFPFEITLLYKTFFNA